MPECLYSSNVFVRRKDDTIVLAREARIEDFDGRGGNSHSLRVEARTVQGGYPERVEEPQSGQDEEFDIPSIYAVAGPDTRGNLIEVLLAEQEDGSFVAYHAMKLTVKMARELGLC